MRRQHARWSVPALVLFPLLSMCGTPSSEVTDTGDGGAKDGASSSVDSSVHPVGDAGASPDASSAADALSVPDASGEPDAAFDAAPDPVFAAGVTTRTFVDTTRITPKNGTEPEHPSRTLLTEIWYPTTATTPLSTTTRDAPLAPGGPFPLVLFVHGSSSSRTLATYLTIPLAQAGYVVAAADFPLTALSTPGGSSDLGVSAEVGDLAFLCDQLGIASTAATDALKGAVTGQSYVVVGHSTGGAVAQLAAFAGDDSLITHDSRVRGAVALSGDACMFDPGFYKSRPVPMFAIGATDDLFVRLANSGQWVYDNTNAPHILAKIVGGHHMGFTDLDLPDGILNPIPTGPTSDLAVTLQRYGDAGACLPVPAAGTDTLITAAVQHAIVVRLVTAFVDAELRGNPGPLNAIEAANDPQVVILH